MAPGMAAAMSRVWDAGVSRSAPPLTTIVLAVMDASAWYTLYLLRLGRKPAAVVKDVVRTAAAATAAAAVLSPKYLLRAEPSGRTSFWTALSVARCGMR